MKPFRTLLLFIAATLCALASSVRSNEVIKIVGDPWFPYNGDPKAPLPGYMIELAQEIFAEHHIEVQYHVRPWSRALAETQEGTYDAIMGASQKPERELLWPSVPQGISRVSFLSLKSNSWKYNGINSLRGQLIGIIKDYEYFPEFMEYIYAPENKDFVDAIPSGGDSLQRNIEKVRRGRIVATIDDSCVLQFYLGKLEMGSETFVLQEVAGFADPIYIAFTKNKVRSTDYVKIMSEGTIKFRTNGRLKEILAKYHLVDWMQDSGKKP